MRRLERGASYIPLIIVIVLLIVAVVWAWIKTDEGDQLAKQVMTLTQERDQFKDRSGLLAQYLQLRLSPKVGHPIQEGTSVDEDGTAIPSDYGSDYVAIQKWLDQKVRDLTEKYKRTFPSGAYTEGAEGGFVREDGEIVEVRYVNPGGIRSDMNLENLYDYMDGAMDRMLNDITRYVGLVAAEKAKFTVQYAEFEATMTDKDTTISDKETAYETLRQSAAQRDSELSGEIRGLEDQLHDAQMELEAAQKAHREEAAGLKNELLAAKQDVRKAKRLKSMTAEPIGPDGEILSASEDGGIVVIDRGRAHHMLPGSTFTVFNYGKGAVKQAKGIIQVLDVDDRWSKARILETVNPMRPITEGDLFESAAYNPDEVIHFYLLGRFRKYAAGWAAWALIVCGWGNVIASFIGPLAGVRGLSFTGLGWNTLVFLLFMVAIVAVFIAMPIVARGAWARYRE